MLNRSVQSIDTSVTSLDNRMVGAMRLALAASALLIIYIDPSEPDRLVPLTYGALILYTLYSAAILYFTVRSSGFSSSVPYWSHWVDVVWYLLLVALSSGTSSIFFFFFFFSILVTSFRWGFRSGLSVTLVAAFTFTIVGYFTAPPGSDFELNRFLLRPIYLCVFGYMMAYLGGYELMLKSRLALLKEVSLISNPRFGIDRTIGVMMERLRAFYGADTCLLITMGNKAGHYSLRHATGADPDGGAEIKPLDEVKAGYLLAIPDPCAIAYSKINIFLRGNRTLYYAYDLVKNEPVLSGEKIAEELADMLDATAYASIPLLIRNKIRGRVFLTRKHPEPFNHSDIDFLLQVVKQVLPLIENIMLVDRLATEAAEEERKKIARDIHDSIIQPYIGLQMGLASVDRSLTQREGVEADTEELKALISNTRERVGRLAEMTESGISDLRRYIHGLTETQNYEEVLLNSLKRFAAKFGDATGITVTVEAQRIQVNDRLAAEIFQIVAEGLSNIRRHTQSPWAMIKLAQDNGSLILKIENDNTDHQKTASFTPNSISMRAKSLGGFVQIEHFDNTTCVIITVLL